MLSLEQIIELYDEQLTNNDNNKNNKKSNKQSIQLEQRVDLSNNQINLEQQTSREKKTVNFLVKNRANKLNIGKKLYEFFNAPGKYLETFFRNDFELTLPILKKYSPNSLSFYFSFKNSYTSGS